jgi:hypothetical protein
VEQQRRRDERRGERANKSVCEGGKWWAQYRSSRVQCKLDWTIRVCNLHRRGPTPDQPRNEHLQHKPETKTYGPDIGMISRRDKYDKTTHLAFCHPYIFRDFCRRCTNPPLGWSKCQSHRVYQRRRNLTCDIATIVRNIRKVHGHLKLHKLFRRETQSVQVAVPNLVIGVEVKYLGVQVGDLQRYEVGPCIDLQFRKSREREVCGGDQKPCWNGAVEVTGRR